MICYAVMIQNDEHPFPQICCDSTTYRDASYKTIDEAKGFIDWMVDYHGHSRKDYFIAKIVRLKE